MGHKVVVTGGTGYTGNALVRKLLDQGHEVRTSVRDKSRAQDLADAGAELYEADLRDEKAMAELCQGAHTVYHIAANYRKENVSRQEMFDINHTGTINVLTGAEKAGVERFVHCSTVGVHGDIKEIPAKETTPFNPGDHYQESKLAGEEEVWKFIKEGRLQASIYRPAGILGPGERRFLKMPKAIKNGTFFMIGDGKTLFHIVDIDDLTDGIILCATQEEAIGNVYILAGPDDATLNEMSKTIADILGKTVPSLHVPYLPVYYAGWASELIFKPLGIDPPLHRRRVDFFHKNRSFDISKARNELGYAPKYNMKQSWARTIESYEQLGWL
ncbi:MAG: NAD-dependent epimerase/dehydratase family protein [Anaerolineae bacterium]|nr:NAD-dependent epimerase/dehydratase family protein [Anaerolineae bacterium]MCA9889010.1 NAD-dependent epimerase/dehydratase family protein [Anaerolineae bacterium]MCA9892771.1 NAD-dependent epimerase/dehydratase family protein [Anaerolineae bacterium]